MFAVIKKIYSLCGSFKKEMTYGIIFSCISAIFESMVILAVYNLLSHVDDLTSKNIMVSLVFLIISALGKGISKYFVCMTTGANGYKVFCEKRLKIGEQLKTAPMGYFSKQKLGHISNALSSSFTELETFSMLEVTNIVTGTVVAICIIIFMFYLNVVVGIVSLAGLVISIFILNAINNSSDGKADKRNKDFENMVTKVIEYVKGITVVKSFGVETVNDVEDAIEENRKSYLDIENKSQNLVSLHKVCLDAFGVLIMIVSGLLMIGGSLNFSKGVLFIISSFIVYSQLESMSGGAFLLKMVDSQINNIECVINVPVIESGSHKFENNYDIDVENVQFGYENKKIIDNVSFSVPEKTSLAIVGYSGSGKTTICNLITRFWDVWKGDIKIGGVNIKDYEYDELLSKFSMVFQNVYLFNDTIKNNIKLGKPDATDEEIYQSCKKACCYDFIMALPEKFDTVVGEGGSTLSGGEKQRISIARAILKDAPIVILDEATSSVDPENEADLLKAINALKKDKTIISIAHRMATVKNADNIIVMDSGKIVQKGTHDELIKQEGIYRNFLKIREKSSGWQL